MPTLQISESVRTLIQSEVLPRFLRYVQVETTADGCAASRPSSDGQWKLLRMLEAELIALGLQDIELDASGFLWGTIPATRPAAHPIALLAHVDTSPDQSGKDVRPRVHAKWDGTPIRFPDDSELILSIDDCPELKHHRGDTIITASGQTLLGADDKAGVAEIMAAAAVFQAHPELPHGPIQIVFTRDEEIGYGVEGIDLHRLAPVCYTLDGGPVGELEAECFDAWKVVATFHGIGTHPGYAKGKMVNAGRIAAEFIAALPARDVPEHADGRRGFCHLTETTGSMERAQATWIVRDFDEAENAKRLASFEALKTAFLGKYPGLRLELALTHQYRNMATFLRHHQRVIEKAEHAIQDAALPIIRTVIRGGTDGSRLSELGHPCPNLFAGQMLIHSRREWIALSSMAKAVETIIHLGNRWTEP